MIVVNVAVVGTIVVEAGVVGVTQAMIPTVTYQKKEALCLDSVHLFSSYSCRTYPFWT